MILSWPHTLTVGESSYKVCNEVAHLFSLPFLSSFYPRRRPHTRSSQKEEEEESLGHKLEICHTSLALQWRLPPSSPPSRKQDRGKEEEEEGGRKEAYNSCAIYCRYKSIG